MQSFPKLRSVSGKKHTPFIYSFKPLAIILLLIVGLFTRLIGQNTLCEDVNLQACTTSDDGGYRTEFPFYFNYTGSTSPPPASFSADEIFITFTLIGNGIFDYDLIEANLPQNAPPYVYVNGLNDKEFIYYGACDTGPHVFDFADCQDPTIFVYVIAEPGATIEIETDVKAYYVQPPLTKCMDGNDDYDNGEIASSDPLVVTETLTACSSDFSIEIKGLPTGPVSPHEEVQLYLEFQNNSSSSITLSELDFRLRITDVYGNLGGTALDPAVDPPLFSSAGGDEYYYFLNSFLNSGVVVASGKQLLLSFSILPPAGLTNQLGEAEIELMAANMCLDGGGCCSLDVSAVEGVIEFPGEPSCDGGNLETVQVVMGPHPTPGSLVDCEVGFAVYLSSPDSWKAERLLLDLETVLEGNMSIVDVSLAGGLADCPDCLSYTDNSITYTFDDNMTPLNIDDGDGFIVVLDGLNGSLENIEFINAAIGEYDSGIACIPDIVSAQGLSLPLASACNYCDDVSVEVGSYYGSPGSCEQGFTIYLNGPDNVKYDEIFLEFEIANPNNLTLNISSYCQSNPIACQSGSCPVTPVNSCTCYDPSTGILTYRYCDPGSTGINVGSNFPIISVSFGGMGCVPSVIFKETTFVDIFGGSVCTPKEYSPNNPLPLCTNCPNDEFTISGNIRLENGAGVAVPIYPTSGDIYERESAVYFVDGTEEGTEDCTLGSNYECINITSTSTSTSPCNGNYDLTFECEEDGFLILPKKDIGVLNGVTTFDIVLLTKHILGTQLLDSPYKIIAADANRSNSVTTFDQVAIRRVILFIDPNFTNNTSWRFVDASYSFPNPANPFSTTFPECRYVDLASNNAVMDVDFIGIKIGDVNNSVDPCNANPFTGNETQERVEAAELTGIIQKDRQSDETVVIDFYITSPRYLVAWQLGLYFDSRQLQLEEAIPGQLEGMSLNDFGLTQASEGKLRMLWASPFAESVWFGRGIKAFSLRFKKLSPSDDFSTIISLDDSVFFSATYEDDGSAGALSLNFRESDTALANPVNDLQEMTVSAIPNPFSRDFRLIVSVPEDDWLEVAVFDVNGRKVTGWAGETKDRRAEVIIIPSPDWGTGAFTYRARTALHVTTGKITRQ